MIIDISGQLILLTDFKTLFSEQPEGHRPIRHKYK